MKKIYVGNLSYQTTEEALETAFAGHGTVVSVAIIRDKQSGQSRGFGFVEMESDDQAEAAIDALNGSTLDGRTLTVNEARSRTDRTDRPRRRFGDRPGRGSNRRW